MANHISLTSKDGSMTIVDKNRIISCETFCEIDEEKYDEAMEKYNYNKHIWDDKKAKAFFENSRTHGEWLANNPAPNKPDRKQYQTAKKLTLITLANKTSIVVKESTEEIMSKIKEK